MPSSMLETHKRNTGVHIVVKYHCLTAELIETQQNYTSCTKQSYKLEEAIITLNNVGHSLWI